MNNTKHLFDIHHYLFDEWQFAHMVLLTVSTCVHYKLWLQLTPLQPQLHPCVLCLRLYCVHACFHLGFPPLWLIDCFWTEPLPGSKTPNQNTNITINPSQSCQYEKNKRGKDTSIQTNIDFHFQDKQTQTHHQHTVAFLSPSPAVFIYTNLLSLLIYSYKQLRELVLIKNTCLHTKMAEWWCNDNEWTGNAFVQAACTNPSLSVSFKWHGMNRWTWEMHRAPCLWIISIKKKKKKHQGAAVSSLSPALWEVLIQSDAVSSESLSFYSRDAYYEAAAAYIST